MLQGRGQDGMETTFVSHLGMKGHKYYTGRRLTQRAVVSINGETALSSTQQDYQAMVRRIYFKLFGVRDR